MAYCQRWDSLRVLYTGNIYAGLYYPMIVAAITFIVGSLLLRETNHTRMWDEFNETVPNERPL
ncbi:MAG TPA: hypothetical protein VJ023_15675 [Pyrinomonadaceae bacterium]|nr:hypothetical protein [Pyrinomonadaceae bacterium]